MTAVDPPPPSAPSSPAAPPTRDESSAARPELNETPPVLGSWRNIYLFVLGTLAALIALLSVVTRIYS